MKKRSKPGVGQPTKKVSPPVAQSVVASDTPVPALSMDGLVLREMHYRETGPRVSAPGPEDVSASIEFETQYQTLTPLQVVLTVRATLTPDQRVHPLECVVVVSAAFRRSSDVASAAFVQFLSRSAPSVIFPYLRELFANVTLRTPFGATHLNPLVLQPFMDGTQQAELVAMLDQREPAAPSE